MKTTIIGIAGGSGSGKTTLAKELVKYCDLIGKTCKILRQDSYYIDQSHKFDKDGGAVNFDHPDALEFSLMSDHLKELKSGKEIQVPIYDFASHTRSTEIERFSQCEVVILDGILIFSQASIAESLDYKVFVDASEENRFQRRLSRDVAERGRTEDGVRDQFYNQVKPMHDEFVEPFKGIANDICPNNGLQSDFHQYLSEYFPVLIKKLSNLHIL